jgi:hypothetical protein
MHNEEHFHSSTNITVIKSRRMRWERHVARMGIINAYKVFVGKPDDMEDLGVDECMSIMKKQGVKVWAECM